MLYKKSGGEFAKELEYLATVTNWVAPKNERRLMKQVPRILIVDDDPDVSALLCTAMKDLKVETVTASDGHQALERINKDYFNLILLDFNMPKLDGEQVLQQISHNANRLAHGAANRLPVITYSAKGADLTIPLEEGFYILDHWQKPMQIGDLKSQMIMVVGRLI